MKSLANFPADKSLTMEEIIKQGGYYSKDGVWNNITEIDGKIYRGRVEVLVVDQDQNIFLQMNGKNKYRIPGGSFEKDQDHRIQAYNEVLEEARIICENVTYTGIHYIKEFDKKFDKVLYKPDSCQPRTLHICVFRQSVYLINFFRLPRFHCLQAIGPRFPAPHYRPPMPFLKFHSAGRAMPDSSTRSGYLRQEYKGPLL